LFFIVSNRLAEIFNVLTNAAVLSIPALVCLSLLLKPRVKNPAVKRIATFQSPHSMQMAAVIQQPDLPVGITGGLDYLRYILYLITAYLSNYFFEQT
jgi:hypothetical protein